MRALRSKKTSRSVSTFAGNRLHRPERLERRDLFSSQGLDASFGNGGIIEETFPAGPTFAQSASVQPDGKIVVGGSVAHEAGGAGGLVPSGFVLARYNADGTADPSFGTNGATPLLGGIADTLVQSDGKLLVAAGFLARYNADGTLDTTFGQHGIAPGSGGSTWINLQSDGKILTNGTDFTRYNADGTIDTTFGTGGYIIGLGTTRFVVLPDDGFVTVAGNVLQCLTADGKPDSSFGAAGRLTLPVPDGKSFRPTSLLLTADGDIDCVGNLMPSSSDEIPPQSIAVFQINAAGSLNHAFGDNGETIITSPEPFTDSSASVLQPDGKLVIVGRSGVLTSFNAPGNFAGSIFTARLDADGALDPSWGNGGTGTIAVGSSSEAGGVALTPSGQIVIVGDAIPSGAGRDTHALVVMRLDGDFNEAFVQHAYLDLLDRPVDPTALTYLTAQLDGGELSRGQVVQIIQSSPEYFANIVRQDYVHFLRRPVDPTGLRSWTAFLESGGSRAALDEQILSSDEYYDHIGGGDRDTFLNQIYLDLLKRPIDAVSRAAYDEALLFRTSRATIIDDVLNSPEFSNTLVDSLYLQLLSRPADAAGRAAFVSQLAAGATPDLVIAEILASNEYDLGP